MKQSTERLLYGLLAVCAISVTLPATRAAVAGLDPLFVGLGRELIAASIAAVLRGEHIPVTAVTCALVIALSILVSRYSAIHPGARRA